MSKERLQDIKKKYNYERLGEFIDVKPVNPYELKWLIEQAERVQELEKENKRLEDFIETIQNVHFVELQREKAENRRYREALEKITNDEYIQDYCDRIDCYEYEAMREIAKEAQEGEFNE